MFWEQTMIIHFAKINTVSYTPVYMHALGRSYNKHLAPRTSPPPRNPTLQDTIILLLRKHTLNVGAAGLPVLVRVDGLVDAAAP